MISRENAQRKIVVMCNVADRALGSVIADIQKTIAEQVELPQGYYVEYGGQFESAEETRRRLTVLGVLVVLGIGFLLHLVFRSVRDSLLIMVNLRWLSSVALRCVCLRRHPVRASVIGFISVFGIAARNGIMMVSHIAICSGTKVSPTFPKRSAAGATERLAPILMTALAAGLALILWPSAVSSPA